MTLSAVRYIEQDTGYASPCWVWQRSVNSKGYPLRSINRKVVLAHRAAYEAEYGDIPAGFTIHHRCEHRRCVNPDHLALRTHLEHAREHTAGEPLPDYLLARWPAGEASAAEMVAVAEAGGYTQSNARMAIRRLHERGAIVRVSVGRYAPAERVAA